MRRMATLAGAAATLAVLAGPAGAAGADGSAQDTINDLQRQGYAVQIDKLGTGPISKCVVISVRNPQTVTQLVPYVGPSLGSRDATFLVPVVTSQTISVSLDCNQR
ncbi:MAG: hypothetical protein KDB45_02790 [Mycobacterium sp.]|nr:hypothetical protein [Mycobacterium sp.]